MPIVTLSSKNQITLPADIVRSFGLKAGDKLIAELVGDHIVLMPQPESWADYFVGSMKGVYGSTTEEIDRYIAEVRHGWDIDALRDALSLDEELRSVYKATSDDVAKPLSKIREESGVRLADQKLEELERLHAVKRLPHPQYKAEPWYRRVG